MKYIDGFEAIDDRRFKIKLKQAFPLLPAALGKSSSSQCFIMPERMARTDPMKQVTETIGSGPYRFLKEEWVSGAKAAWAKFDGYIPRKEPVNGIAGGRIPAIDRIEWSFINDASTAMAALSGRRAGLLGHALLRPAADPQGRSQHRGVARAIRPAATTCCSSTTRRRRSTIPRCARRSPWRSTRASS